MPTCRIALLRGINVGRAKRIAMADLRALFESLGFSNVSTLLNSGNVVFNDPGPERLDLPQTLQAAILKTLGVESRVTVIRKDELDEILAERSLLERANDHSRYIVSILNDPTDLSKVTLLADVDWSPGALVLGRRACYQWCPDGVLESPLAKAVARTLGDGITARNWLTLIKLQERASAS